MGRHKEGFDHLEILLAGVEAPGSLPPTVSVVQAISAGKIDEFRKLFLAGKVGIEEITDTGLTAIELAAQYGHKKIVRLLLEKGTNPRDSFLIAIKYGKQDVINELNDFGININTADANGQTALHRAVQAVHLDDVILLLATGANMDTQDHNKQRALDLASKDVHAVVKFLFERQSEIAMKNHTARLAALAAASAEDITMQSHALTMLPDAAPAPTPTQSQTLAMLPDAVPAPTPTQPQTLAMLPDAAPPSALPQITAKVQLNGNGAIHFATDHKSTKRKFADEIVQQSPIKRRQCNESKASSVAARFC